MSGGVPREVVGVSKIANRIIQLWGLDTTKMTAQRLQSTGEIVFIYEYGFDELEKQPKKRVFTFDEILNIAALSFDGVVGISPIAYEKESIALSMAYEQFGAIIVMSGIIAIIGSICL